MGEKMTTPGWIKLYRKITECEIWKDDDPFSKRDAWIDILLQCNFEDKKTVLGMKVVTIERGSFVTSQEHLAVRWRWGRQKVRSYIKLLEELEMITIKSTNKFTIIKVPNYQGYQDNCDGENQENNQQNNHQATNKQPSKNQQITTTKEYKEYKEVKEDIIPPPSSYKNYISKGGGDGEEFNLFRAIENSLKLPMTRDLADKFIALLEEVGEGVLKEALDESVKYGGRSYAYVEAVARRIASGGDAKSESKGIDWDALKRKLAEEYDGNKD